MSELNHAGQNETDDGHQYVIFWVLLGLCVLLFCISLLYFLKKKIGHQIVHLCRVPKSQGNYTVRRLPQKIVPKYINEP